MNDNSRKPTCSNGQLSKFQDVFTAISRKSIDKNKVHNWTEKLDLARRKVTPCPFLILAAWEPPKPIHFWKGHRKSGRNKDFQRMACKTSGTTYSGI